MVVDCLENGGSFIVIQRDLCNPLGLLERISRESIGGFDENADGAMQGGRPDARTG